MGPHLRVEARRLPFKWACSSILRSFWQYVSRSAGTSVLRAVVMVAAAMRGAADIGGAADCRRGVVILPQH